MTVGVIILIVYFTMAALMVTKKISTFLALTLMGFLFSVLSGEPLTGEFGLLSFVIPKGAVRLGSTMLLVVFACWLGKIMERTGVTQTIIKKAAEFGGDKPLITSIAICAACSLLFTVLNGTGAVALVGTITLPILLSVGLTPLVAASAYLCTYGIGSIFNPANIGIYLGLTNAKVEEVTMACVILGSISAVALLLYLFVCFKKNGKKYAFAAPVQGMPEDVASEEKPVVSGVRGFLACLTPFIIIVCTFVVKVDIMVVFLFGVLWISVFTYKGGWTKFTSMISHAVVEGWEMAAPTCSLMIAVGFLVIALSTPQVISAIMPVVGPVLPKTTLSLILFMSICAPLALYRGPFNPWGMGAGLAAVFLADGTFSIPLYFAFFFIGGRWCNIHDPSSTQCLWSANFAGTDMGSVMKHQFAWDWVIAIIGAAIIIPMYMSAFPPPV